MAGYRKRALVATACLATTFAFGSEATARRAHLHAQGVEQVVVSDVRAAPRPEAVRLAVAWGDPLGPPDPPGPTPEDAEAALDPSALLVAAAGHEDASLHTAQAVLVFLAEALPANSPARPALTGALDELQRRAPRGPRGVA